MLRNLTLGLLAFVVIGCAGGGDGGAPAPEFQTLTGELTDGDINVIDNRRADPYDFVAVRTGTANIRLHATGFHALLRVYDTSGNLIGQSVGNSEFEGHVDFPVLLNVKYKLLVTAATEDDSGVYSIDYSPELQYQSQIK
jgi:hypothetical protein